MKTLTPQQAKKVDKIVKIIQDGDLAIAEHLFEIDEKLDNEIPKMGEVLSKIKGDKGDQGEQGIPGIDGADGVNGLDGLNGKDGKDGKNGLNGLPGTNGLDGRDGLDGTNGIDGKDGSPDSPDQIASKLNTLFEAVNGEVIKGWKDMKMNFTENLARLQKGFDPTMGPSFADLKKLQDRIATAGGTPAGSNTQLQFNSNGAFGASSNFTYTENVPNIITSVDESNLTINAWKNNANSAITLNNSFEGTRFQITNNGGAELDMSLYDENGKISTFMAWNTNGEWEFSANDWGFSSGGFPTGPAANFVWYPNERARMKLDYLGKLLLKDDCENDSPLARLDVRGSFLVNTAEVVSGYVDAQAVVSNPTGAGVFRFEGQDYAKFEFKAIHASGSGINSGAWQMYARNDGSSTPTLHLGALNDAENSESSVFDVFRTAGSVTSFHIYPNTIIDGSTIMNDAFSQYGINADVSGNVILGDPQGNGSGYTLTISDPNFWAVFSPTMKVGIGNNPTALLDVDASTTACASIRIRSGTAPTSPNDGDMWYDGSTVKFRVGGTTKTFTLL